MLSDFKKRYLGQYYALDIMPDADVPKDIYSSAKPEDTIGYHGAFLPDNYDLDFISSVLDIVGKKKVMLAYSSGPKMRELVSKSSIIADPRIICSPLNHLDMTFKNPEDPWLLLTDPEKWIAYLYDTYSAVKYAIESVYHTMGKLCNEAHTRFKQLSKNKPQCIQNIRIAGFNPVLSSYTKYAMRDLLNGFSQVGLQTKMMHVPNVTKFSKVYALYQMMSFCPHTVLGISKIRSEFDGLKIDVPFTLYDQDRVLISETKPSNKDIHFVLLPEWVDELGLSGYDMNSICPLPVGTNPDMYYPTGVEQDLDVVFVGMYYPNRDEEVKSCTKGHFNVLLDARNEYIKNLLDPHNYDVTDYRGFLSRRAKQEGLVISPMISRNYEYMVHNEQRKALLSSITQNRLSVYGDGWSGVNCKGKVENGAALNEVINRAKINLFLAPTSAVHPRLFDIAAAGGFIMANRVFDRSGVEAFFTPSEESVVFDTAADMVEKINFYLPRERIRKKIGERARQRVIKEHTWKQRAKTAADFMLTRLKM